MATQIQKAEIPKAEELFRVLVLAVLLLVLLTPASLVTAESAPEGALDFGCTGFAVYAGEPIYGMNFDYPPRELRFSLTNTQGKQVFRMEFPQDGDWYSTVGMNSDGVFSSAQMLFPKLPAVQAGPDDLYVWAAADYAFEQSSSASVVLSLVVSKRLVEGETCLHSLVADPVGTAFVLEPGPDGNRVTPIQGRFLLMTNFPVADFAGRDYRQVQGAGADRYQKAWVNIEANLERFDPTLAMETLRLARSEGGSPTLCSLVFLPRRGEILIALDRDYAKIWKVSLRDGTIATMQGFPGKGTLPMGAEGTLASAIKKMPLDPEKPWLDPSGWLLLGLGTGLVVGLLVWWRFLRKTFLVKIPPGK